MTHFALPTEIEDLQLAAQRFARDRLGPNTREFEAAGAWPDDVLRVLDDFSLRGLDLPESLGGAAAGCVAKVVALEALAQGDAGGLPGADGLGTSAGAIAACPDGDLASTVVSSGSCALVVGEPRVLEWAPGANPLRWVWVSDDDTLSLLEIDGASSVDALAFHASAGVSADLEGARVAGRWELPPAVGLSVRGRARLWSAAVALGIAQGAFDATVAYTTERVVFGRAVAHHQGNAFELAVAATNIHGARLAVRDAASRFDGDARDAGYWATQAWITTMDAALHITDLGIQLLGGHGFLVDHLAEKRFREVGMLRLLAGGRDAADTDLAAHVLATPDPIFA
jgi:acyl-CoA dehydrogenase